MVLNNREGKIFCTPERREEIQRVAAEMNYRPNLLARSMVSQRSLVVGVMLNVDATDFETRPSSYFNNLFPALTFALNEENMEVLFVPYRNEEDQLRRLDRLVGNGIVGGIITNLIPLSYDHIASRLTELRLPYMILGYPHGYDCHCVFRAENYYWREPYEQRHGIRRSYLLTDVKNELKLFPFPFPESYMWLASPIALTDQILADDSNLIICSGIHVYRRLPCRPRHVIITEILDFRDEVPADVPAVFIKFSRRSDIISLVTRNVVDWMQTGQEPELKTNRLRSGSQAAFQNLEEVNL